MTPRVILTTSARQPGITSAPTPRPMPSTTRPSNWHSQIRACVMLICIASAVSTLSFAIPVLAIQAGRSDQAPDTLIFLLLLWAANLSVSGTAWGAMEVAGNRESCSLVFIGLATAVCSSLLVASWWVKDRNLPDLQLFWVGAWAYLTVCGSATILLSRWVLTPGPIIRTAH